MLLPPLAPPLQASPPIALAWRDGYLCVSVALMGGKPSWFLLDTGCYRSYLTNRAYARLAASGATVAEDGTLTASGASIGGYDVPPIGFGRESDAFLATVDPAADGYLGMDVLGKYRIGLDVREKTLRLWPATSDVDSALGEWQPSSPHVANILMRDEGPCVNVEVGNLSVPMLIDTGCSQTFLHTEVAAMLRNAKRKKDEQRVAFYNGLHRARAHSVRSVVLGGLAFGQRTVYSASVPRIAGILGRDLLSPLRVFLDYPGGKAYFSRSRPEKPVPPPPVFDGPHVAFPNGVIDRWPLGVVAHVPSWATYTLPAGYREVFKADESVDLVPLKGSQPGGDLTSWPGIVSRLIKGVAVVPPTVRQKHEQREAAAR